MKSYIPIIEGFEKNWRKIKSSKHHKEYKMSWIVLEIIKITNFEVYKYMKILRGHKMLKLSCPKSWFKIYTIHRSFDR